MQLKIVAKSLLTLVFVLSQHPSYADDLDSQRKALQLIRDTAADICSTVAREGSQHSAELSGDVKAKLGGVVGKIADLGIEGAGKYRADEYRNVLQKDLAGLIQSNANCRLDVFKLLQEKMIGPLRINQPPNKAPATTQTAAPTRNTSPTKSSSEITDVHKNLHESIRVVGRYVRYTQWLDGTQSCWNGAVCGTASFVIENRSSTSFNAAIKAGATSIGPCIGREIESAGLKFYNNNPGWNNNVSFNAAQTIIPANARVPVTIKLENCAHARLNEIDVTATLTVSIDGKTFDLPISVADVPVR